MKPLGKKSYGSIPHLPGSRLGIGDRHIGGGQVIIATEKVRDSKDIVIIQEKLDGSNMSVAKINGEIVPLTRSGYIATTSQYKQHHFFANWVEKNRWRFDYLLKEGERVCGEWLAMAHGTRYKLEHEPFVAFDLISGDVRVPYLEFFDRVHYYDFIVPRLLSIGEPKNIDWVLRQLDLGGYHNAIDPIEGAVWRVERSGKVDFLCKYVRHDKEDGKYFANRTGLGEVWNIDLQSYGFEL